MCINGMIYARKCKINKLSKNMVDKRIFKDRRSKHHRCPKNHVALAEEIKYWLCDGTETVSCIYSGSFCVLNNFKMFSLKVHYNRYNEAGRGARLPANPTNAVKVYTAIGLYWFKV